MKKLFPKSRQKAPYPGSVSAAVIFPEEQKMLVKCPNSLAAASHALSI
jgi:hypothetical protein